MVKEIQAGREDAALMFCVRSELGGHPGQRDEPAAYEHARGCAVRAVSRSTWPPGLRPQTRRPERQLSFFVDQCTWLRSCLETLHPLAVVWHLLELRHLLAAGWAYQALPEGWARLACPDGAKLAADCVPTGAVANRAWPVHADAAGLLHFTAVGRLRGRGWTRAGDVKNMRRTCQSPPKGGVAEEKMNLLQRTTDHANNNPYPRSGGFKRRPATARRRRV